LKLLPNLKYLLIRNQIKTTLALIIYYLFVYMCHVVNLKNKFKSVWKKNNFNILTSLQRFCQYTAAINIINHDKHRRMETNKS